jgi:hypothetical protein
LTGKKAIALQSGRQGEKSKGKRARKARQSRNDRTTKVISMVGCSRQKKRKQRKPRKATGEAEDYKRSNAADVTLMEADSVLQKVTKEVTLLT